MVHDDFILTPISKVLDDVHNATDCISVSIDTYPLCDYIIQSLFIKMTGFQEQKLKCICWELASIDYDFRRETFESWPYSTCSEYKHKNSIFSKMYSLLRERIPMFEFSKEEKRMFIDDAKNVVIRFYKESKMQSWLEKEYHDFSMAFDYISEDCILTGGKTMALFAQCEQCSLKGSKNKPRSCHFPEGQSMHEMYKELYANRNRCAHNVSSYQQNLPHLNTMASPSYIYRNYLLHFAILVFIDNVFISMYMKWLEATEM